MLLALLHHFAQLLSSPGVGSRAEFASRKACYWSRGAHATASFLWYIASSAYAEVQSHDRLGTIVRRRCGVLLYAWCRRPVRLKLLMNGMQTRYTSTD
jgi:hypothetical protein